MGTRRPLRFDPIAEARRNWEEHGWTTAAPGMAMVTSVMRAQQILLARVHEALRPEGLTFAQYEALMLLSFTRSGRMPLSKIGQRLQVHPTSVTNVIDRLESKHLVERIPHPTDQRTTLAAITRKGRAVAERATTLLNEQVFQDAGLDDADAELLTSLVTEMRIRERDFDPGTVTARPSSP